MSVQMALELVGNAFLSSSVQKVVDGIVSGGIINFFRKRKLDGTLLDKLKFMLLTVITLLEDAEAKQWTNPAIKAWVDDLKDVIYKADDLVDEIASLEMQSKLDSEYPTSTSSSSTNTTQATIEDMASRMEQIVQRLENFVNAKDFLGLRVVVIGGGRNNLTSHRLPTTTSLVDHDSIYGRDDDKEKIIQMLISEDDSSGHQVSVIPIVGMGGIGKTTLAQLVYNDRRVVDHFDMKSWVCVSEEFDILAVTKTVLQKLSLPFSSNDDLDTLQIKLRGTLAGQKFFIVLDDVWNENYDHWDRLRIPFGVGKYGSKIIVTTRKNGVASIMKTVPSFHLEQLSTEDCWLVFSKHAFENVSSNVLPDLKQIGRQIVEKCKGLPLAAKTLGGLLRSKGEIEDWVNVLESQLWDLPENKSNILPALLLSYHHLPSHLKLCFAYCAIIPKDYPFEKDELVPLWIAEGFVQERTNRRIEDAGDHYFHELISMSLFQQSNGKKFLMHDLINDLAQFVAGEFYFRLQVDDRHLHDLSKVRYFSYWKRSFYSFAKLKTTNVPISARTFKSWNIGFPNISKRVLGDVYSKLRFPSISKGVLGDVFSELRCIRVLSIREQFSGELPDSIDNLIHLRYLDISDTGIICLPETVSRLCNLETLLLRNCRSLFRLPKFLCKLIRLRHLDIRGTNLKDMPMQIGKLRSLQQLPLFVVGNQTGSAISELRDLDYLRGKFTISNLQNVLIVRDALDANLNNKKHLEVLKLEYKCYRDNVDLQKETEVLEKLQPHINLKDLIIEHYCGTRFPDWLGNPLFFNLKSLRLVGCTNCSSLPPLGQLPSLKELTISRMNKVMKVGSEFYGYDSSGIKPFQSLEMLEFSQMLEWEEWSILGAGLFCQLQKLCIKQCPKLIGKFPKHLPYLKRLEISDCQNLVIEKILKLDDYGVMDTDSATGVVLVKHLSSLQELEVMHISQLQTLPLELCRLTNLEKLSLRSCPILQIIGGDHGRLSSQPEEEMKRVNTKLHSLEIFGCPKLELPLSEDTDHHYKFLRNLTISERSCDSLKSFPSGFFPRLHSLVINGCKNFESLSVIDRTPNLTSIQSRSISDCPNMVSFAEGGLLARNLTKIRLGNCKKLKTFPEQMCTLLPFLQSLELEDLPELELPLYEDSEHHYKFLQELTIRISCDSLKSFPLGFFPKLRSLNISGCKHLESLSGGLNGIQNLTSLQSLNIQSCPNMVSLADRVLLNLTSISIWSCEKLKALPEQMCTFLPSLQSLVIEYLPEIKSVSSGGFPYSLSTFTIGYCNKLMARGKDWGLQRLPSLRQCMIAGECEEDRLLEYFPEECLLPTSLISLCINNRPNMKSLNPNGLRHLNSLQNLVIGDCPELQSLPDEGLPSSLLSLCVWKCPLLKVRCQREKGKDWLKISHIPHITLDNEEI